MASLSKDQEKQPLNNDKRIERDKETEKRQRGFSFFLRKDFSYIFVVLYI